MLPFMIAFFLLVQAVVFLPFMSPVFLLVQAVVREA
jgi:hypothetical protein|tara:strand:- start:1904 stop:2011 length:108 start_codon:yes stop_codon:yes gene_type:complete